MKTISEIVNNTSSFLDTVQSGEYIKNSTTTGLKSLDKLVGRMRGGEMWVVGGYNGSGKSYWVLNMLDSILKENPDKSIAIYSSEMDEERYMLRWACKRVGCWELDLQSNPDKWVSKVKKELQNIRKSNWQNVHIQGYMHDFDKLVSRIEGAKWDIVFVDFVQNLNIEGAYSEGEKMPIIATELAEAFQKSGSIGVVLSQMNNQAMTRDFRYNDYALTGLSFGKQLNHFAQTTMILSRIWNDKGNTLPLLKVNIKKARGGDTGRDWLEIKRGYNIKPVGTERIKDICYNYGVEYEEIN